MNNAILETVREQLQGEDIESLMEEIEAISKSFVGKTVDEWLNSVDYSDNSDYIPSEFALHFVNFMKAVDGTDTERNLTPVVHMKVLDSFTTDKDRVANLMHRGIGKALSLTTPIPTPDGWTTMGDLKVGDKVLSSVGKECSVVYKSPIHHKPMYLIRLADGRALEVCEDHNNIVLRKRQRTVKGKREWFLDKQVLTTKELLEVKLTTSRKATKRNPKGSENRVWIPNNLPVEYSEKVLPIDPYTLGVIMGDGSMDADSGHVRIHGHEDDIYHILNHVPYEQGTAYQDKRNPTTLTIGLKGVGKVIKHLGLNKSGSAKYIPADYLRGSLEQRLSLLQGLMDTDGTITSAGNMSFSNNSQHLAEAVQELVLSLGGISTIRYKTDCSFEVSVRLNMPVFRLQRKLLRQRYSADDKVAIESITPIATVPSQCITVDSEDHSFLAGDYVVTHNTTLIEYLFPYLAMYEVLPGFGKVWLAIYVSDSMDNGVASMKKNLEYRWENSEFLQYHLPKRNAEGKEVTKFTEARWVMTNREGNSFIVKGYGAQSGIRGVKEMGKRPQLAILDDLVSDEDAKSPTVLRKIKDNVYRAIEHALDPEGKKIIWCGTPFNAKDPLYEAVESGTWEVNVYPICEHFPCSRTEFKGSWEDRFTYKFVLMSYLKALNDGELASFNQELMLRIMSEEDRLVAETEIQWYSRNSLMQNKESFNFYITTDFATSEKDSGDYSFMSVWAINHIGELFWIDGICAKQDMGKNIDDLFGLCAKYQPQSVGIETSGQQGGFIPWLRKEMQIRNFWFTLASSNGPNGSNQAGIRSQGDKITRFNIMLPRFKQLRMYFPEELASKHVALIELIAELRLISDSGIKSKYDDGIDTVSMLGMMKLTQPSADVKKQLDKNSIWGLGDNSKSASSLSSYIV